MYCVDQCGEGKNTTNNSALTLISPGYVRKRFVMKLKLVSNMLEIKNKHRWGNKLWRNKSKKKPTVQWQPSPQPVHNDWHCLLIRSRQGLMASFYQLKHVFCVARTWCYRIYATWLACWKFFLGDIWTTYNRCRVVEGGGGNTTNRLNHIRTPLSGEILVRGFVIQKKLVHSL